MIVLGIDAAWTETEPSGVSVISSEDGINCKVIRVAASYDSFLFKNDDLISKPKGSKPEIGRLLTCIKEVGCEVDCIAIDMPLSKELIKGRRSCENEVSKIYGSKGASTHTPSIDRPGTISLDLVHSVKELGYSLSTKTNSIICKPLIEVYPHTAIIEYLQLNCRFEYKVSKKNQYKDWKALKKDEKDKKLITNFNLLIEKLKIRITNIEEYLPLLDINNEYKAWYLKGYEDMIDSLFSALVGMDYLFNRTIGYGSDDGTIWVPIVRISESY
jgi:predicted RNase H-like nuclease